MTGFFVCESLAAGCVRATKVGGPVNKSSDLVRSDI